MARWGGPHQAPSFSSSLSNSSSPPAGGCQSTPTTSTPCFFRSSAKISIPRLITFSFRLRMLLFSGSLSFSIAKQLPSDGAPGRNKCGESRSLRVARHEYNSRGSQHLRLLLDVLGIFPSAHDGGHNRDVPPSRSCQLLRGNDCGSKLLGRVLVGAVPQDDVQQHNRGFGVSRLLKDPILPQRVINHGMRSPDYKLLRTHVNAGVPPADVGILKPTFRS